MAAILMRFLSSILWYVLIGLIFAFLTDQFDHDWFHEQELGASRSSHINYDIYAPLVYVCMYIAFGIAWPIVVWSWCDDHFEKGGKNGRTSD